MRLSSYDFVFSNAPRHRIARHAAFWGLFVLFSTFIYGYRPELIHYLPSHITWGHIFANAFAEASIYCINHILLSYAIIYWVIPHYLLKGRYLALSLSLLICVALSGVLSVILSRYLINGYREAIGMPPNLMPVVSAFMGGLRGGITIAGFAAAVKLAKYWYLKQQAFQQVEKEKLTAELQLLKAQLHPHFLFNTLNNLYALTLTRSAHSPEVVLKLSGLLSYMLYECNGPEVSLAKEIQMLQNYVELERMRYGDRVEVSLNFTGDISGQVIAPLLLIPFVENAFKHGVSEQIEQAWISLDLSVENNMLRFKLINSKNADDQTSPALTGGIGLQNVRKRLELLYPGQYELKISGQEEIFVINLNLQLHDAESHINPSVNTLTQDLQPQWA